MPNRTTNATHIDSSTTTPPPLLPSATAASTTSQQQQQQAHHISNTTVANSACTSHMANDRSWQLACSGPHTAHSRRRRRYDDTNCNTSPATAVSASYSQPRQQQPHQRSSHHLSRATAQLSACAKALSQPAAAFCVAALLVLCTCGSFCAASPCDTHSWWDPVEDKCIPCTLCQGELIPLRPCQLHRDTICGSIYDLKIDWVVLAKTEPNWKERRKSEDGSFGLEEQLTPEELQQLNDEGLPTNWQTFALFLAVLACLLFFIVAACILMHHMRQWRRMERRLDKDVEEMSTKLMAKLAEVQSLEGGTFFIGNADALRVPTTFQPQHVLLPEKPAKQHDQGVLKTLQPGNVYIEGNGSKG